MVICCTFAASEHQMSAQGSLDSYPLVFGKTHSTSSMRPHEQNRGLLGSAIESYVLWAHVYRFTSPLTWPLLAQCPFTVFCHFLETSHVVPWVQHNAFEHQKCRSCDVYFAFLSMGATRSHVSGACLCVHAFSLVNLKCKRWCCTAVIGKPCIITEHDPGLFILGSRQFTAVYSDHWTHTYSAPTRSELWHVLNLCCMTYEASNAWFHMLFATRLEDTILSTQMHFIVFMYYLYALLCTSYAWIHDAYMDCTILK